MPSLDGLLVDLSYRHKKGYVVGVWNFSMDAGYVVGPLLGGTIAEAIGIKYTFFITGLVLLMSIALLLLSKVKKSIRL